MCKESLGFRSSRLFVWCGGFEMKKVGRGDVVIVNSLHGGLPLEDVVAPGDRSPCWQTCC